MQLALSYSFQSCDVPQDEKSFYLQKIRNAPFFKGAFGQSLFHTIYANKIGSKETQNNICNEVVMTIPSVIR